MPSDNILIMAIVALSGGIVGLFWQYVKVRDKEVEAYKLVAPLVTKLVEVIEELQPILENLDKKKEQD